MNTSDWLALSLIVNAVLVFAHWRAFKMLGNMYRAVLTADRMLRGVAAGDIKVAFDREDRVKVTDLRRDHGN